MTRRKRNGDEVEDLAAEQTPDQAAEQTETEPEPETQLDRIEAKLDQLLEKQSNVNTLHPSHAKVPYKAPELPRGLSPNEIINHPLMKEGARNPEEALNPMVSETEPATVEN